MFVITIINVVQNVNVNFLRNVLEKEKTTKDAFSFFYTNTGGGNESLFGCCFFLKFYV